MRRVLLSMSIVFLGLAASACNDGSSARSAVDTVLAEPAGQPAPRAGGDDGTIKVFDEVGCQGSDGGNDPKVTSPLSIGGTGFGPAETGTMTIETQPGGRVVYEADFTTAADGTFCVTPVTLEPGQYKAVFEFGNGTGKQKVFKIEGAATTTTAPEDTTTTTEPDDTTTTAVEITTTTEDVPPPSSSSTSTTTTLVATTTTEVDGGLPTTTTGGPLLTTTTAVGGGTTTTTSAAGGGPTTTAAGGGGPTTTAAGGGPGATTIPGTTPGTGAGSWFTALIAALALLAGVGLVRLARRPAAGQS